MHLLKPVAMPLIGSGRWGTPMASLLMLVLFLAFLVQTAAAYPTPVDLDGSIMRWDITEENPTVTFEVAGDEGDLSTYGPVVENAAQIWSAIPTSYLSLQPSNNDGDEAASISVKLKRSIDGSDFSAGFSTFDKDSSGRPSHCRTEVLVGNGFGEVSIAKTILHELGHCIGLGHSVIPRAIMSYTLDRNSFDLDVDDEAAVSRLYPVGGTVKLPPGCSVGSSSGTGRWVVILVLLFLPIFPGLIWLRGADPARGSAPEPNNLQQT